MWLTKLTALIAHAIWKSFVQLDFIRQLETVSAMTKLTLPSVAMMVETVVDHIQTQIIALIALAMAKRWMIFRYTHYTLCVTIFSAPIYHSLTSVSTKSQQH